MDLFVARQPIFDREQHVFGYELLFRSGPENYFSHHDLDEASTSVIKDSVFTFGIDHLAANKRAFINVTRNVLIAKLVELIPPERVVVELLEAVEPDADVLATCRALKKSGYLIALDDFAFRPELEPLLSVADIVKIEYPLTTREERQALAARFANRPIKLLAEKVETNDDFRDALSLGFVYFQGYFFCRPEMISRKTIPAFKLNCLKFIQEVNRPEIDFNQLEQIIKREVSLSVNLLRYLNSAAFNLPTKVTSIKQALVLLGARPIKKWASLVALTSMRDDKPPELLVTSLVRGRFCELVGPLVGLGDRDLELFLTGLLSAVDALLDRPMAELLSGMAVSYDVRSALLQKSAPLGPVHALALAYERGEWSRTAELAKALGLPEQKIPDIYRASVEWADQSFAP